jgi:hypothetical protein
MDNFEMQFLIWEAQFEPGVDPSRIQMFLFGIIKLKQRLKELRELVDTRKPEQSINAEKKSIGATVEDFAKRVVQNLTQEEKHFLANRQMVRKEFMDPNFWLKQISQTAHS